MGVGLALCFIINAFSFVAIFAGFVFYEKGRIASISAGFRKQGSAEGRDLNISAVIQH